jgi:Copper binding proteins, plastocyanin/azurin family
VWVFTIVLGPTRGHRRCDVPRAGGDIEHPHALPDAGGVEERIDEAHRDRTGHAAVRVRPPRPPGRLERLELLGPAPRLVNNSSLPHNLPVDKGAKIVAQTRTISGSSATTTANLTPGEYVFSCSVDAHRAAGMQGTLTVNERGAARLWLGCWFARDATLAARVPSAFAGVPYEGHGTVRVRALASLEGAVNAGEPTRFTERLAVRSWSWRRARTPY